MNAHAQIESFLDWLLNHSLQAAVLVLLILAVQTACRRRLTARWRFAMWWILLLQLLLPFRPTSAFSVFNFVQPQVALSTAPEIRPAPATPALPPRPPIPAVPANEPIARAPEPVALASAPSPQPVAPAISLPSADTKSRTLPAVPAQPAPTPATRWREILVPAGFAVWLAGVLGIWLVVLLQVGRFQRRVAEASTPAPEQVVEWFEACHRELQVTRPVQLLETGLVQSPALCGLFRLRLLLPTGLATRFDERELRYIFLHELAHVRRGDLWLNWLVTALQSLHWFNPLLWLGFARLRADRELACDEIALSYAGEEQGKSYGQTIVKLLEGFRRPAAIPGLVGIVEDTSQMRRRLRMIAAFKQPTRWSALALLVIVPLGCVSLSSPQTQADSSKPKTARAEKPAATPPVTGRRLELRVVDLETSAPVPGAVVSLPYYNSRRTSSITNITDKHGLTILSLPEFGTNQTMFIVHIARSGYPDDEIKWFSSQFELSKIVPATYTAKPRRGETVGGILQDAKGQPLPGVAINLRAGSYVPTRTYTEQSSRGRLVTDEPAVQEYSLSTVAAQTDALGRWQVTNFPAHAHHVSFSLSLPDGRQEEISGGIDTLDDASRTPPFSMAELRKQSAVVTLPEGIRIRGTVVDDRGNALSGVSIGYAGARYPWSKTVTSTQHDGRFELPPVAAEMMSSLTVMASGYATTSQRIEMRPDMPEIKFTLHPSKPLRLRIVDETGVPLPGVTVTAVGDPTLPHASGWSTNTDAQGRAAWADAPLEILAYSLKATNRSCRAYLAATGEELEIKLRSMQPGVARFEAHVLDANTRAPVPSFKVGTNGPFVGGYAPWSEGAAGVISNAMPRSYDTGNAPRPIKLRFTAPGYASHSSAYLYTRNGDHFLEVRLQPAAEVPGIVRLPNGNPADGAEVWLSEAYGNISSSQVGRFNNSMPSVHWMTDRQGRFTFVPPDEEFPMGILHMGGYALLSSTDFLKAPEVALQPWGQVKGTLIVNGQPVSHQRVTLTPNDNNGSGLRAVHFNNGTAGLYVIRSAETDSGGRFTIEEVPAGEHRLFRTLGPSLNPMESHAVRVTVQSGKATEVRYTLDGRNLKGRLLTGPMLTNVSWTVYSHYLSARSVGPAADGSSRLPLNISLDMREDGSFTAVDVPPGTYHLNIPRRELNAARDGKLAQPERYPGDDGYLQIEVVVPPARNPDETFDLGDINVTMKATAALVPPATTPSYR